MELQLRFIAGLHVPPPRGILQVHGISVALLDMRKPLESTECLTVQPRLQSKLFRLLQTVAQRGSNGFVDHFFFGNRVGRDGFLGFTEIDLALDKTIQPRKVGVDVRADILGGNGGRKHYR